MFEILAYYSDGQIYFRGGCMNFCKFTAKAMCMGKGRKVYECIHSFFLLLDLFVKKFLNAKFVIM